MKIQNDVVDNDDDEIYGRIFFFLIYMAIMVAYRPIEPLTNRVIDF